jgi:hypothetical protein
LRTPTLRVITDRNFRKQAGVQSALIGEISPPHRPLMRCAVAAKKIIFERIPDDLRWRAPALRAAAITCRRGPWHGSCRHTSQIQQI